MRHKGRSRCRTNAVGKSRGWAVTGLSRLIVYSHPDSAQARCRPPEGAVAPVQAAGVEAFAFVNRGRTKRGMESVSEGGPLTLSWRAA
jgi:hypothetical protein